MPTNTAAARRINAKTDAVATPSLANRPEIGLSGVMATRRRTRRTAVATANATISSRNIQPIGDWLKACKLLKMPLRVRNAAKLQAANVATASNDGGPLQGAALAVDHRGMNHGGGREPRDQRAVLHRVPVPIAAPTEFFVGPIGPHEDADSQHGPGEESPRPGVADPGGVQSTAQQRRDGQGKGNRATGIAEEHHGRVQQHRRMLQQRAEPAAFARNGQAGLHRVGAEHHDRHEETLVGHQDGEGRLAQAGWASGAARNDRSSPTGQPTTPRTATSPPGRPKTPTMHSTRARAGWSTGRRRRNGNP